MFTVDRSSEAPLGQQVQEALRDAMRSGALASGERLPSTRDLADQLGVSRGLVVSAYEQLAAEGYVVSVTGSGTRVAVDLAVHGDAVQPPTGTTSEQGPRIDFGYGVPDLGSFPARDWLWALTDAARAMPTADLGDGAVEGDPHLRSVLARRHRRVRAGYADPAHTIVVGGFRHGLNLVLAALVAHGIDRVALEDPGPREHDRIARRCGMRVAAVAVDADGLRVDHLRESGARAVLLTPAHQCPTGAVLSPSRRQELVRWAHEVDGVILEDDYDAEFRYDRQPVGSLQGLAPDRVVALGSVSKTLAPALRIGWVFTPPRFHDAVLAEAQLTSRGVPQLDQAALARLMESGRFDRHLRRVRERYHQRRDELVAAVDAHMPAGVRVTGLEAGHHLLLQLPSGLDETRVVDGARTAGVAVRGLRDYRVVPDDGPAGDPGGPALVIGYGNVTGTQLRDGIRVLGELVAREQAVRPRRRSARGSRPAPPSPASTAASATAG